MQLHHRFWMSSANTFQHRFHRKAFQMKVIIDVFSGKGDKINVSFGSASNA
jgi:hypothetical protein